MHYRRTYIAAVVVRWSVVLFLVLSCAGTHGAAIIQLDYTYDSGGFLSDPTRRAVLDLAVAQLNRFIDDLDAIVPSGSNHWTYWVPRPDDPNWAAIADDTIAADTVKVYVGGRSMSMNTLALGGASTFWTASGSAEWKTTIKYRGQGGAAAKPATDFSVFAGSIAFNTDQNWYFGTSTAGLDASHVDLLTVTMHELAHILGFGPADSWQANVSAEGKFLGAHALAAGSSNNPELNLDATHGHWAAGTLSELDAAPQTALLGPVIPFGTRYWPTALDRAGLLDIGWEEAMAGDVDRDRDVDSDDIQAILAASKFNVGPTNAVWAEGDFDGNQRVDDADIQMVLDSGQFGKGPYALALSGGAAGNEPLPNGNSPQPYPSTLIVPEPSTTLLLASGATVLLWLLARRQRKIKSRDRRCRAS